MMCPNKNHPDWKALEATYGTTQAFRYWMAGLDSQSKVDDYIKSKEVPIKESVSKLDDQVYEALGIKQVEKSNDVSFDNLNEKLKKGFLKDFNVTVQEYENIKKALGLDSTQAVSLVEKFIAVQKGANIDKSVAYLAYSLLGKENNKLRSSLRYNIYSWDKFNETFKKHETEVKKEKGFIKDKTEWKNLIRDRVIIDYLAETIVEYYNNPVEFEKINSTKWTKEDFSLFKKIVRAIRKLLGLDRRNSEELKNIAINIAHEVLTQEYDIFNYELSEDQVLKNYDETINSDPFAKDVVNYHQENKMVLTGSLALRKAGTVYRTNEESLHDLDFVVPSSRTDFGKETVADAMKEYNMLNLDPKDGVMVSEFLYKKFIEKSEWFKNFRKKYPSYRIVNQFVGSEHIEDFSSVTLTGVIDGEFYKENGQHEEVGKDGKTRIVKHKKGDWIKDTGYVIDHFVRLAESNEEHDNYFKLWKEIMIAKLMMGRGKDFVDFKAFVPFIKSKDTYNFYYPDYIYQSKDETPDQIIPKESSEDTEDFVGEDTTQPETKDPTKYKKIYKGSELTKPTNPNNEMSLEGFKEGQKGVYEVFEENRELLESEGITAEMLIKSISKNKNSISDIENWINNCLKGRSTNKANINTSSLPKAEQGIKSSKFTKGGTWKIIKDLQGYPTHEKGGVDLMIGKDGVNVTKGESNFKAEYGLVLPKAQQGMVIGDPPSNYQNQQDWQLDYINSPQYKQILTNEFTESGMDPNLVDEEIARRAGRVSNVSIEEDPSMGVSASSLINEANPNEVYADTNKPVNDYFSLNPADFLPQGVNETLGLSPTPSSNLSVNPDLIGSNQSDVIRELAKASTAGNKGLVSSTREKLMNATDVADINARAELPLKKDLELNKTYSAFDNPTRIHSQLTTLKKLMQDEGIYNPMIESATPEHIQQMLQNPNIINDPNIRELIQLNLKQGTDIGQLLNSVASNNNQNLDDYV